MITFDPFRIGKAMKYVRVSKDYSLQFLAQNTGLTGPTIINFQKGQFKEDNENAKRVIAFLDPDAKDVYDFVERAERDRPRDFSRRRSSHLMRGGRKA